MCRTCGKIFTRQYALNTHKANAHGFFQAGKQTGGKNDYASTIVMCQDGGETEIVAKKGSNMENDASPDLVRKGEGEVEPVQEEKKESPPKKSSSKKKREPKELVKPLVCQVCKESFNKWFELRHHIQTGHLKKPCDCPNCKNMAKNAAKEAKKKKKVVPGNPENDADVAGLSMEVDEKIGAVSRTRKGIRKSPKKQVSSPIASSAISDLIAAADQLENAGSAKEGASVQSAPPTKSSARIKKGKQALSDILEAANVLASGLSQTASTGSPGKKRKNSTAVSKSPKKARTNQNAQDENDDKTQTLLSRKQTSDEMSVAYFLANLQAKSALEKSA